MFSYKVSAIAPPRIKFSLRFFGLDEPDSLHLRSSSRDGDERALGLNGRGDI